MKHLLLSIAACWITAFAVAASPAYEKAMQRALEQLAQADSPETFRAAGHQFERIAQTEPQEWLPRYYTAYSFITQGAMTQDITGKDQYLDRAQEYLDQARELVPEESEVVALQGYLHMIRLSADPANRGPELAPQATQELMQAVQMDADNPRALLLLGQMKYGTAQFFKSDTAEACELVGRALAEFERHTPSSPLHPQWGRYQAEAMQSSCGQ